MPEILSAVDIFAGTGGTGSGIVADSSPLLLATAAAAIDATVVMAEVVVVIGMAVVLLQLSDGLELDVLGGLAVVLAVGAGLQSAFGGLFVIAKLLLVVDVVVVVLVASRTMRRSVTVVMVMVSTTYRCGRCDSFCGSGGRSCCLADRTSAALLAATRPTIYVHMRRHYTHTHKHTHVVDTEYANNYHCNTRMCRT